MQRAIADVDLLVLYCGGVSYILSIRHGGLSICRFLLCLNTLCLCTSSIYCGNAVLADSSTNTSALLK